MPKILHVSGAVGGGGGCSVVVDDFFLVRRRFFFLFCFGSLFADEEVLPSVLDDGEDPSD